MPFYASQDPDAISDYSIDWSDWLDDGETVDESTWSGPAGVALTPSLETPHAIVRVEITDDGLIGTAISLVNHVVSSDGQEDDRTLKIRIKEK